MTAQIAPELQRAVVTEAARAPSVHNIQPARWRFTEDGGVVLYRALDRVIPVGDPTGHDLFASLGAAWEGMTIALTRHGVTLGPALREGTMVTLASAATPAGHGFVSVGITTTGAKLDPDADAALARRAWRGVFVSPPADLSHRLASLPQDVTRTVTSPEAIARIGTWHDEATLGFMRDRACFDELVSWLRLSPDHPDWYRDGLTADAMALNRLERLAARVTMQWRVFRRLRYVGADRLVVSERPAVRSAAALVAFAPPDALPPFDTGRRFYRLWLALERAGLSAVPMSAVCDAPETRALVAAEIGLPRGRRLANLLRVGIPARAAAQSPRLPIPELVV